MLINNIRFLELASNDKIFTPLKSFTDSVLFYYLGRLALKNDGELLEIGCGGSTYVLYELSQDEKRPFTLCDLKPLYKNAHTEFYPNAIVNPIIDYSKNLYDCNEGPFVYSHVDGDKDYLVTKQDVEYCIDNLAVNGLICQDDYGNNKWPTVTQVILDLVSEEKLKFILVGDSSAWLTIPEYYDYWMDLLNTDREFNVLSHYFGIRHSSILNANRNYYFINTLDLYFSPNKNSKEFCTEEELIALNRIHEYKFAKRFLKMPYTFQSTPGIWLK